MPDLFWRLIFIYSLGIVIVIVIVIIAASRIIFLCFSLSVWKGGATLLIY